VSGGAGSRTGRGLDMVAVRVDRHRGHAPGLVEGHDVIAQPDNATLGAVSPGPSARG